MSWAADRRQEWIAGRLVATGFIQRKHLVDHFQITMVTASGDIQRFLRERPGLMTYDKTAKRYVRVPGMFAHASD